MPSASNQLRKVQSRTHADLPERACCMCVGVGMSVNVSVCVRLCLSLSVSVCLCLCVRVCGCLCANCPRSWAKEITAPLLYVFIAHAGARKGCRGTPLKRNCTACACVLRDSWHPSSFSLSSHFVLCDSEGNTHTLTDHLILSCFVCYVWHIWQ